MDASQNHTEKRSVSILFPHEFLLFMKFKELLIFHQFMEDSTDCLLSKIPAESLGFLKAF